MVQLTLLLKGFLKLENERSELLDRTLLDGQSGGEFIIDAKD